MASVPAASRLVLPLLLVLPLVMGGCTPSAPPPAVVALNNLPVDSLQLRMISEQRRKTSTDISDPELRGSLAMALEANGLGLLAIEEYRAAAMLGENDPLWQYREASVRLEQGETKPALDQLVSITKRFPDFAPAWHKLAATRLDLGDDTGAEDALEQLQKLVPQSIRVRTTAAEIALTTGDAPGALEILEKVTSEDRQYEWAYMLLGQTYLRLGETGPIIENLLKQTVGSERKYEEDARERQLRTFRAGREFEKEVCRTLIQQNRSDVAAARLIRAIVDFPGDMSLRLLLAQAHQANENEAATLKVINDMVRLDPSFLPAYLLKVDYEIQRGDRLAASGDATSKDVRTHYSVASGTALIAMRHAPNDWRVHFARGRAETKLNNDRSALTHLKKARELEPESVEICLWLFEVSWRAKDQSLAMNSILAATELDATNIFAWANLGMLHSIDENLEQAQAALQRVKQLDPAHPAVQSLQGRVDTLRIKLQTSKQDG